MLDAHHHTGTNVHAFVPLVAKYLKLRQEINEYKCLHTSVTDMSEEIQTLEGVSSAENADA